MSSIELKSFYLKGQKNIEFNSMLSPGWNSYILNYIFNNEKYNFFLKNHLLLQKYENWIIYCEKILSGILIFLAIPILFLIAILIKLDSSGNILFKQVRVGKNNKFFEIYKFRTMIENAEKETGHTLSWEGDPRITKLGLFLRKTHLDELPQLINVFKGEMSFIGPRPERPEFVSEFQNKYINYNNRHQIRPGITGLAQISLVYDVDIEKKLELDLLYLGYKNSLFLKLIISFYTIKKMLFMRSKEDLIGNIPSKEDKYVL